MKDLWNKRYSEPQYSYGAEPNQFLKENLAGIKPGKALFIAEGEGRNAVYAASLGWVVDAVDFSEEGKRKADLLATEKGVKINYVVEDLENYNFTPDHYDLVVYIFVHLHHDLKREIHQRSISSLKKDGLIIMEVFEIDQLKYSSGGPKTKELLYSLSEIAEDFINLDFQSFSKEEVELGEGKYHQGRGMVIRFIAKKEF
ncbi:MAG: class I SAM-dependent methyltransferase [Melioribacteraceae bacterium]|nr:class I SAM-dependent methyltransferase [Melioribacteraceae bacterium]MCF8262948.1 class I SAM-dependent methyltransferase [Melioribacteraceae bacterium]MCF8414351.1 class I SAM-dependent methyltransferase [Melioribacteraceae bacterium]MCF8430619.1 class I SAM-dependent methyltransferase [Melioribacteraceae bacterium]